MSVKTEFDEYETGLLRLIDEFLAGNIDLASFQGAWIDYYIDTVPDDFPDEDYDDFFWSVHDKIEVTGEQPSEIDLRLGWMSRVDFTGWLRDLREGYRRKRGH